MEQWKKCKIRDIVEVNAAQYTSKDNWEKALYLDTGNITENKIDEMQEFDCSSLPSRARRKVKHGDIIFSTVRPNQKHYGYITNPVPNLLVSTGFAVISVNQELANSKFIYYWLSQYEIVEYLHNIAEQSVSAYPSIKASDICNLEIKLPPLEYQSKVASILSTLENKISLNHRINGNLEQQAQTLFNHYFIERPDLLGKYKISNLTGIANYLNGLAMQKFRPQIEENGIPVLKIKELGQGYTDASSDICSENIADGYKVHNGDVIFSWSGTLMVKIWCGGLCGLNQHLFKVSSEIYPKWFYYFWTKHHLNKFIRIAQDKAVTMGHIKRNDLEASEILIPQIDILAKLDAIISPLFSQIIEMKCENRNLAAIRDILLPQLMSGKLKINDLNR